MKQLITLVLSIMLSTTLYSQSKKDTSFTFIKVTKKYEWPDGLSSNVGEIEVALSTDDKNYVIWHDSGRRYSLPKQFATSITGNEAAISLIKKRQKLYANYEKLEKAFDELDADWEKLYKELELEYATATSTRLPTSVAGKMIGISKNDRIRMLRVIRSEKYISSIRRGEKMADAEIVKLYNKALEKQRLRAIENAIRIKNQ